MPKTPAQRKLRVKAIILVALPIFMASSMVMVALCFRDNWWLCGWSLGALLVMWVMWLRTPFGEAARNELKEKVYEAKGEKHCGNPNLQSDQQLIADGVFMYHTSLMAGSIWLAMITPVFAYWGFLWLFAKYIATPWGL